MQTRDFDYTLPSDRIAQHPAERREQARLLVVDRDEPEFRHATIESLPDFLSTGDRIVVNDVRVDRARLHGTKSTGGRIEVLLLELRSSRGDSVETWSALLGSSRTPRPGTVFALLEGISGRVLEVEDEGTFLVELSAEGSLPARRERAGEIPLPPYIQRPKGPSPEDEDRYQTVYATTPGAVAAPTAGLHLTPALFEALRRKGIERTALTLHVGPGTFRPVKTEDLASHRMHEERFHLPEDSAEAIGSTRERGGRVVAVGTTSVRVLETCANEEGELTAQQGSTRLFIHPGYRFRAVDALLTNFHLPKSTLLMLVCAFGGKERILSAYREAIREGYRFYSYGDAMLIL